MEEELESTRIKNDRTKNEIYEIKKWEENIKQKDLKYRSGKYKYDFQQNKTVICFGESIYAGEINIHEAELYQTNLLESIIKFKNKSRSKRKEGRVKKRNTFDRVTALYEGQELTLNAFKSEIFPIKEKQGEGLKILTLR